MVRYLTRFHCGNWGSAGQKKNAPATHTRHDVFQLSSLHATHCVRKKKRENLPLKNSRQILALAATIIAQFELGRHRKYCLLSACKRLVTIAAYFYKKKKKKEISCSELLKMLMISVALQNILSFTMYGTSLKYSDLSEWIEITYILT